MKGSEAVTRRCSVKMVLLKSSQNSQGSTYARVSFSIKLQSEVYNFIRKEALAQVFFFAMNFEKFLRTLFFAEHLVSASGTSHQPL